MVLCKISVILFSIVAAATSAPSKSDNGTPIVKTKIGDVQGTIKTTLLDRRPYHSFQGIPYAKPPVGPLRFRAPQKAEPWQGVLNATDFGPKCLQTTFNLTVFWGEEDCLTLNVYTPNLAPKEKLAVVMFIHGGGYMCGGSGWLGPDIIMDEDVILVTINYRLGPFGFLSLNTPEYPGNAGLKDQLLALKWINENIEYFGGDSGKITVFGQSAGAAAVHLLTLIPAAQNLFQRAIVSSGSMLNPWSYTKKNHTDILGKLVSSELKIPENELSSIDIVEWLKTVNGTHLGQITFSPVYTGGKSIKEIDLVWAPVIEIENGEDAILTKPIVSYLAEPSTIDTLFGYTSAEAIIIAPTDINNATALKTFDERFEVQLPLIDLHYDYFSKEYDEMVKDVRKFYFGDKAVDKTTLAQFIKLLSDVFYIYGIDKSMKAQSLRSSGNTFYYQFSVDLELNSLRKAANASALGLSGATHIEDMLYIFKIDVFVPSIHVYYDLKPSSPEGQMMKSVTKFFMDFARYGNPMWSTEGTRLRPVRPDEINYVDITNNGFVIGVNPHARYIEFWNEFLSKHKAELQVPEEISLKS